MRGNSVATRNTRLAAIHSLFRYASRDLVRISPGEIRRLLAHLIHPVTRCFDRIAAWSHLRRRYQARAKQSHYQRRLREHNEPLL